MATKLTLEQFDAVGRQAQALGSQAKGAISSAILKGAQVIAPAVSAKAPRSAHHRGGGKRSSKHLADVITTAKAGTGNIAGVTVEGGANGASWYWKFLEHGTRKMKARPYFAPAAAEKEDEAMEAIGQELKSKLGF